MPAATSRKAAALCRGGRLRHELGACRKYSSTKAAAAAQARSSGLERIPALLARCAKNDAKSRTGAPHATESRYVESNRWPGTKKWVGLRTPRMGVGG